jgi:hypothetical protein
MAVVATLSKGYDLDYIWKQVDCGPAKDAASYYIQASETGGEPPGRWWGPGARTLGFEPGQTVEREPYDLLFGERKAPDGTRLGRAPDGPAVTIADGAAASAGDLIICTQNDHTVEAGEPGRMLANGDLLRIDAVTGGGLVVRRALDADPRTGQRRWTGRPFLYAHYRTAELGYAVTDHVAQGRTVHTGPPSQHR